MDREDKVGQEVDALISQLRGNADPALRDQIHSYAQRVFSLGPTRPHQTSDQQILESLSSRVSQHGDQRAVVACQDAAQRFLHSRAVYRKQDVLRMLLKLSELNHQEENAPTLFRQVRKRELNVTTDTQRENSLVAPLSHPRRQTHSVDHIRIARNRGLLEQKYQESDLVRQLIFIFSNTSSIDIMELEDGYQLRPNVTVSDTVKKMIRELGELGWLHKQILKNIEKPGTVGKALKLAVSEELNEYYRWIASMETLAKAHRLSLRKLVSWAYQPEMIMRQLAVVLEAVGAFQGAHIISILNSFRPNGLTPVQALLDRLLGFLLQPLLNYIHSWVYLGQLLDSRGQFFIGENKKVSDSEEWTERFQLVLENVPNVLDTQSARKIFIAGKTIYFLRNRCKVVYNLKTKFPQTRSGNGLLGTEFNEWLMETHQEVGAVLVEVLMQRFHLQQHLLAMKDFFLCGKGDFVQQLYDSLREKLSQKKYDINEHSLDGYISDAIGKCFVERTLPDGQNARTAVLDRLLAKKIDYGHGGQGWDCFNLQYSLEQLEPMQALLSPEIMMNYQKIFFFLWKLKQVQEITKSIWVMHARNESIRMRRARSEEVGALFHSCYILRNSMNHFLHSLFSYLMVSIQTSWDRFSQALAGAPTFDDILKLHREFQQEILDTTLNTPKGKQIYNALTNIFSVVTSFKACSIRLQESFEDYFQKWRLYEDRQGMARKGIMGNQSLQLPEFGASWAFKTVNEICSNFNTAFKNFYHQISKEGDTKLSSLSFKLDYSEYYCNIFAE